MVIRRTFLLLVLVLTGCVAASAQPAAPPDPYALRATAQAAEALAGQVEQQARATQSAQESFLRQTAEAVSLEATRQALHIESTRQALAVQEQAYTMTATAQAVERQILQQEKIQHTDELTRTAMLLFLLLILLALGSVLVALVWKAGNQWIEWQSRRRQLIESRAGTLLLVAENAPPVRVQVIQPVLPTPLPITGGDEDMPTDTEPIPYSVNGELVGFIQRRAEPEKRLALRLLRESIQAVGAKSNRIPGWRELGWSAEVWTQAVRLLWRYVETQPGR
uniref:hypothetical protein n=1 Tax=Bellilinea sp. TaxID=2838785 RepID=UPI002ADE2CB8